MKIENLKLKIGYLLICLLSYLFIAQATNAAQLSLSLDPPIIIVNAIPPTNVVSSFKIQNKSDTQVALQIQLKSFQTKGENGQLDYSSVASQVFKYVQISDGNLPVENITLGPKQEKTLSLSITVPQDANIGDYYFSIIFVSANAPLITSNSSVHQIGIATNVLLSVGEKEIPQASLEEFSTNIFIEKGPVSFTTRIRNAGTHLIQPKGEIIIKNMFGQNIGKLNLLSVNVLSDSIRAIPSDTYSLDIARPVALWKEGFLLGIYSATLNISMSNEGPIFTRTIHFFAFPLQLLIIIVIITMVTIVVKNRLYLYMNKDRT